MAKVQSRKLCPSLADGRWISAPATSNLADLVPFPVKSTPIIPLCWCSSRCIFGAVFAAAVVLVGDSAVGAHGSKVTLVYPPSSPLGSLPSHLRFFILGSDSSFSRSGSWERKSGSSLLGFVFPCFTGLRSDFFPVGVGVLEAGLLWASSLFVCTLLSACVSNSASTVIHPLCSTFKIYTTSLRAPISFSSTTSGQQVALPGSIGCLKNPSSTVFFNIIGSAKKLLHSGSDDRLYLRL